MELIVLLFIFVQLSASTTDLPMLAKGKYKNNIVKVMAYIDLPRDIEREKKERRRDDEKRRKEKRREEKISEETLKRSRETRTTPKNMTE